MITLLFSCSKDKKFDVKYEFSSDVSANYTIQYATSNDQLATETVTSTSWSKDVTMKRSNDIGAIAGGSLTVFPPAAWATTSDKANITLKIFANGDLKESSDTTLTGANLDQGIRILATF